MGEDHDEDAVPAVAPLESTYAPALTFVVDGESFELRPDGRRGTHYAWLSGPTDGYGFTVSPTRGCSLDDHRGFIHDFLDQIDPATGFVGD